MNELMNIKIISFIFLRFKVEISINDTVNFFISITTFILNSFKELKNFINVTVKLIQSTLFTIPVSHLTCVLKIRRKR